MVEDTDFFSQIKEDEPIPQDVALLCFYALKRIKAILEDDSLDDENCFWRIEEIVRIFENIGTDAGSRHDF